MIGAPVSAFRAREHRDGVPARRRRSRACGSVAGRRCSRRCSTSLFLDFFFVPPRFTFAVSDVQYLVTFGVMLTIGLVIATLMSSVRQQTRVAGARERRTALLYAMSRELAAHARHRGHGARRDQARGRDVFQCQAIVLFPNDRGKLRRTRARSPMERSYRGADLAVAQWVADHGRRAGLGSDTLPAAPALYLPLGDRQRDTRRARGSTGQSRGACCCRSSAICSRRSPGRSRSRSSARGSPRRPKARASPRRAESLRNTLLASISHDLRTPLAVMAGAGSTLAEHGASTRRADAPRARAFDRERRRARCRSSSRTCST